MLFKVPDNTLRIPSGEFPPPTVKAIVCQLSPSINRIQKISLLNVREGPGTKHKVKPFTKLTKSAQSKIKKISGKAVNGYVKGLTFTCYEVKPDGKYVWGRTPSGWVALDYCERV